MSPRERISKSRVGQYLNASKIFGPIFRPWLSATSIFEIERLHGGSFNRIIGINISQSYKKHSKIEREFILRVPRFEDARPDRDVATIQYVRHRTNIPVAKIVAKDYSSENPLGKSYVVQRRVPGKDLQMTWADLSHEQRCTVAREHAKTLLTLQSLTNSAPGLIEKDSRAVDGERRTLISPYELRNGQGLVREPESSAPYAAKDRNTLGFFIGLMDRWRAVSLERPNGDVAAYHVHLWESLMDAVDYMHQFALFKNDDMSLCHLDLQPRNIMAEIQHDGSLNISGYLDWDSAVFAPRFVGCAPPRWLWADEEGDYDEDDEHDSNATPSAPEKQEIKRIFEEAVGADYLEYAYAPQYPLARMLFRIAKNGVWSNEHIRDVDKFMAGWKELRTTLESQHTFLPVI